MRKLILNDIESFRSIQQGFNKTTMRWSEWYISTKIGVVLIHNKKDKEKYNDLVQLCDTNQNDFKKMQDEVLLTVYVWLIKQISKQM